MAIASFLDVVEARQLVMRHARERGFRSSAQTMFATATSEIARNVLVHAGGGVMRVSWLEPPGMEVVFEDTGEGIDDLEKALTDGYSTKKTLGLGLGGARRLVHEFEISSSPQSGTTVRLVMWRRR